MSPTTSLSVLGLAGLVLCLHATNALAQADGVDELRARAAEASALPVDATFLSTRAASAAARGPGAVLAFVRDHIAVEPYRGHVRGARGTLFSRSGNSLDIALLVGALLDEQGVAWRLARADLDPGRLAPLVASLVPVGHLEGEAVESPFEPASERWLLRNLEDHWWVEADLEGAWIALDPSYPGLALGEAATEAAERVSPDELGDRLATTVTIHVSHRRGMASPDTVLTYTANLADLAYRNLVLSFTPEGSRRLRPTLEAGGGAVLGDSFERNNAERLVLELEFGSGAAAYRLERELRHVGEGVDLFESGVQVFSILFLPGWVGPDYYRAVAGALTGELVEHVASILAAAPVSASDNAVAFPAEVEGPLLEALARMTGLLALSFAEASDENALGLGAYTGVRPYYTRPRILLTGAAALPEGLAFQIDLRDNEVQALPWAGLPARLATGFHVLRGRLDAELTGRLLGDLTGLPVVSASVLLGEAWDQGLAFTSISGTSLRALEHLELPDAARERIGADASGGGVVMTPRGVIAHGEGRRMAWWRLQSATGQVYGVLEDGLRDAVSGVLAAPEAGPRRGLDASTTADAMLRAAEALVAGVLDQARHGRHVRDQACRAACDVQRLSAAACGDPAQASVSGCLLAPRSTGGDPLGLGLDCAALVDAFRCGSWIGLALVEGRLAVTVTSGRPFGGPWGDVPPPTLRPLRCECH